MIGRYLLLAVPAGLISLMGLMGSGGADTVIEARQTSPKIRALLIDGASNHDWQLTTQVIQAVLAKDGRFDVTVLTVPVADRAAVEALNPTFSDYDVVLQTYNNVGDAPLWPSRMRQGLEDFLRQGGGMFAYHAGNNAFETWPEYNRMIGLGWRPATFGSAILVNDDGTTKMVPAGEGRNTGHGRRSDVLVTRIGDHPIHAGLPRQYLAADIEVYTYARGPAGALTVLSFGRDTMNLNLNHPLEWVVNYGAGRVYTSTLGHVWPREGVQPSVRCAAYQTLLVRALQWAAKRPVDRTAPADFPTAARISLRASPVPGREGGRSTGSTTLGHEVLGGPEAR
jgi:type 1 glutamine amidotransferase